MFADALPSAPSSLDRLSECLEKLRHNSPAESFRSLCEEGLADLTRPGKGHTLDRWRALANVSAQNLSLSKLYEAHSDALAILEELDCPKPLNGT